MSENPYPHAVQTQNVCDVCAFASNTCTRTSNNIYYTPFGYVFQCKIDELLHFLDIEIAETEKKKDIRISNFDCKF